MKVYVVDDMLIKSKKKENCALDSREMSIILSQYHMRLNLAKCSFGVTSSKFLGLLLKKGKLNSILIKSKPYGDEVT